nr:DUF5704 domain-containing protein [Paenibacillus wulumuqiensis]
MKRKFKLLLLIAILAFGTTNFIGNSAYSRDMSLGYPSNIVVSPKGPVKVQTLKIPLSGISNPNPKVVWIQTDKDKWLASRNNGYDNYETGTHGSKNDTYPLAHVVTDKITVDEYPPKSMRDKNNNPYDQKYISELGFEQVEFDKQSAYTGSGNKENFLYGGKSIDYTKGSIFAVIQTETGYPYSFSDESKYSTRPDGYDKRQVEYYTPLLINYTGYAIEKKEIQVTENSSLEVGNTVQLKAEVRTKEYNEQEFGDNWVDITTRSQTSWVSSDPSVAQVSPSGQVTALAKGTTKVSAEWKSEDGVWHLKDSVEITVGQEETPTPPSGSCTFTILPPTRSQEIAKSVMNPEASGHILGDDAANGRHFDATRGIPTSDNLYANAWGYNYLFQHKFTEMKGKIEYQCKISVKYSLKWQEKNNKDKWKTKTGSATKSYSFSFTRDYDYWQINLLEVLGIDHAVMNNYALPGGTVTLPVSGYSAPKVQKTNSSNVKDHVRPDETGAINYNPPTVNGGKSGRPTPPNDRDKLKNMAEGKTDDPQVRNDGLQFTFNNNKTEVMNSDWVKKIGPQPKEIPAPAKIRSFKDSGEKVLYKGAQLISSKLVNKASTSSSGTIFYSMLSENVQGSGNKNFPIQNINTVTVHTPVVDYASISDDKAHNQKTVPNPSRMALILDRPFTVRIPTTGQHLDGSTYPGYGSREYAKYFKTKQVQFPFDVYDQQRKHFYPRNTWIDVPVSQLDTVFVLPVWVDEGDYTVYFRNIAENAPTGFTTQPDANTNLTHHVATDTVAVEVIGRLYDFHVTDIADFNWESVFRQSSGSRQPTGKSFWVGTGSIDGAARGNTAPYTLPIMRGSHSLSGYKNVAVKTGYHFKFDLKTKGNMFGDKDGIRITPTFFYQDKDASTAPERVPVDLYYHTDERKFIRIGSSQDTERRMVTLNQRLRNVPAQDLIDTAAAIYELSTGWTQSKAQYIAAFQKRANQTTYTGGYDIQLLPSPLRTFIQSAEQRPENASASPSRVTASVQQWYGEYSLPAQVYVVPGGTDLAAYGRSHVLDEKSPVFLKNGYITVNFDIESIVNADTQHPHLQYIHAPLSNQWWSMEGYDNTDGSRDHFVTDPYQVKYRVEDGDVLFYDTDQSSYGDFTSRGTH